MKATFTHVALLAIFMYGVLSTAFLYGQTKKSPTPDDRYNTAAAHPSVDAPASDNEKSGRLSHGPC